jgi:ribosomal protein L22
MSPEEQEEKRRRRLLRRGGGGSPEGPSEETSPETPDTEEGSDAEVEPTADDIAAEEATEVVLEADDEAEGEGEESETDESETDESETDEDEDDDEAEAGEPEAEAPGRPARRRRLRRGGRSAAEPGAPQPAPTRRRRSQRDPSLPPPVVRAQAKYVRSSARKARLVCDHIRGKSVEEARAILAHTPRAVARDWSKLLESAVANAEHNHELVGEDLYVKAVHADEGPTIKRFRPRAMGRATRIRKRTSHLTILLTPKD